MATSYFHETLSPETQENLLHHFTQELANNEIGASFSAWQDGTEKVSLHGGWTNAARDQPWTQSTLAPVWSATKGPMAATLLLALQEVGMDEKTRVERIWPELQIGQATLAQLFSHQCGLAVLDSPPSIDDYDAVIHALEKQTPHWSPGKHGYHSRTIGFLADEIIRRIHGITLGEFWQNKIAQPHDLDFFIGLPASEHARVATLIPTRANTGGRPREFYKAFIDKNSLTRQAFGSPRGYSSINDMNQPSAWTSGYPAMGGVGSARGLAKFYSTLLSNPNLLPALTYPVVDDLDQIQRVPTSFAFGTMLDPTDGSGQKIRHLFGPSLSGFGHPGAGGSYGFADPVTGWSFAFVMNHFEANLYPSASRLKCTQIILNDQSQRT